jgi:beta-glucanase (GH16 family)
MSSIDCAGNGFKQAPWTYYEVEANFPTGGGSTWPAVWTLLACHIPFPGSCDDGEIDSPEWFGNFMRIQLQLAFHHWISPTPEVTQYSAVLPGGDPSGVFHKYGTDIGPDFIIYYYDRQPIFRIATPSWAITNWYFLIDLACSGSPPCGDVATVNPSVMQLHYVHVYQHN